MTPQEIIKEIYKLPIVEQKQILDSLVKNPTDVETQDLQIQQSLFEAGLLREIKPRRQKRIGDFQTIKSNGGPFSEAIIRERG